jgi:hypothetical protein
MPLPRLTELRIRPPNFANALLKAETINTARANALRRDRGMAVAERRTDIAEESFEFNKMQKLLGYALDFLPSMEQEEWPKVRAWLGEIGAPVQFLREDVKDLNSDEWDDYKETVVLGAQGIVNSTNAEYKARLAAEQEKTEQENRIALAKEKARLAEKQSAAAQREQIALAEKKADIELRGKKHVTWVTPGGGIINLKPGVKPPKGSVEHAEKSKGSKTEYESDKAKLVDDTRGYYSILMKTLLDDVGDVKAGREEEYEQLTTSLQEDFVLIGEGKKPKWLERRAPVSKPKSAKKKITKEIASKFMDEANNDIEEAKRLAREAGYIF